MDPTQYLLFILVAIIMGWFGVGILFNIRRGNAVLKWMQAGLPLIGEKTTLRWLGSSAVELVIAKAKPPFRRVELVLVLAPRDVPWLWLGSSMRGRRDMLIFRGGMLTTPRLVYDLVEAGSWTGRPAVAQAVSDGWGNEELSGLRFLAPKASLPVSKPAAAGVIQTSQQYGIPIWRWSVRRESPQMELHIPLPNPKEADSRTFFKALQALAGQISDR